MNYNQNHGIHHMEQISLGYLRVLHAVPDAPNVDVYANDKLIIQNLPYGQYTKYMPLPEGTYKICLCATGTKDCPFCANMLTITNTDIFTVAAVGTLSNIGFLAIPDANVSTSPSKAMVRFNHLSPNAPAVDITLPDGTILFSNVSFKNLTPYIPVPASNYTLQVRLAGTPTVVLTVPNINLYPNQFYTVYAIGLVGQSPELEALLVLDGNVMM